jgi:fructan beta-fructosidase
MKLTYYPLVLAFLCTHAFAAKPHPAADSVIADFEGDTYGNWKATGEAFGPGPARGTFPGQMPVDGIKGKGLVNTFYQGDGSIGTLTSPEFKIDRKFITFLIGGGKDAEKTCMHLLVDGKIVRTATGPNDKPGGTEALAPDSWDVAEFAGKSAVIRIVDTATGPWGHISIDQITQSERAPVKVQLLTDAKREIKIEKRYLNLPIKNGAPARKVTTLIDGRFEVQNTMELANAEPDWWAFIDVGAWHGKTVTLQVDQLTDTSTALSSITQSDSIIGAETLYREPLRSQLHFSQRRGWVNDPNGMVFSQGEYHLFYQHNPYGWSWGNMHWGHAVSRDLLSWQELPEAIAPHAPGDMAFSGSAVVDTNNTSGWKKGANDVLVAAYTSTGRGECIVYSTDRGRTFTEFEGNPVVKHAGRDPRLLWHAPSKQWVMAVYDEDGGKKSIAFHTSPDLKKWTWQSRIEGYYECPDLFELAVDGVASNKKWVLTAASSEYSVGTFDGKTFTPETAKLPGHRGVGFYAAQTFTGTPNGRAVQIGWLQAATPGMPFNQSMSLPLQLALRATPDGPRLTWAPVGELKSLRVKSHLSKTLSLAPGAPNPLAQVSGELLELRATFTPPANGEVKFMLRGVPVVYHAAKQELAVNGHRAPAPLRDGKIDLVVFTDRNAYEAIAADGLTYLPLPVRPKADALGVEVSVTGGPATFDQLEVHQLKSIWGKSTQ